MNIDEKIKKAINMCNFGKYVDPKFTNIYPFTTEYINAYIDMFDLKDKTLLTVGSSGDQIFNAALNGCKDITMIDICPFVKEYYYLKLAAIMLMDKEEYLRFFCYRDYHKLFINNSKAFLDSNFYKLLAYLDELNPEVSYFWSELLKHFKGKYIRKTLFKRDEYNVNMVSEMNRYLESESYYKLLREKLNDVNVNFIYDDIFNISIDYHFDNIFLSNVAAYYKIDEFKVLFDKCVQALNDNGKMLVSYLYDTDFDTEYVQGEDEIYNLPLVFKTLSNELKLYPFIGNNGLRYKDIRFKDSVLTYKKVKKI